MSSSLVVPIAKLENIRPHPNANKLEIADVLGYQIVIQKGQYNSGDKVVYFPAGTILPVDFADKIGVRNFLKGKDRNRVGRIRLRGQPSFGLALDVPLELAQTEIGENVAEFFGATKYEPPIRCQDGDATPRDPLVDPFFYKYTNIENGRIFTHIFKKGEEIIVTEKIHGMNNRVGVVRKSERSVEFVAGTHRVRRKHPAKESMSSNTAWFPYTLQSVVVLLTELIKNHKNVILFGEVFGGAIQSLDYGIPIGKGLGYRAFDLIIDDWYVDFADFDELCFRYGIETVPTLYRGPFDFEKIKEIADGPSTIVGAKHMREGAVVRPIKERIHPAIGRVILKYIGTEYALSKQSDFKDV